MAKEDVDDLIYASNGISRRHESMLSEKMIKPKVFVTTLVATAILIVITISSQNVNTTILDEVFYLIFPSYNLYL